MLRAMYATIPVETESKTLQIGIGFASHQDAIWAAVRATAMARTGRKRVEAEFSVTAKVDRTEALYRRLLDATQPA